RGEPAGREAYLDSMVTERAVSLPTDRLVVTIGSNMRGKLEKRRRTMNILVAMDGSTYGQWELNWVAMLPFVNPPRVTALHVLDIFAYRAAFLAPREIRRIEAHSTRTLMNAMHQLAGLKLKGTARKEQGMIAPVILKRT